MNFKAEFRNLLNKAGQRSYINKYTLTIALFTVWLIFFDQYNLFSQLDLSGSVDKLEKEKAEYERLLDVALIEQKDLNDNIEKYGREKFLFHKDNEEIILIK